MFSWDGKEISSFSTANEKAIYILRWTTALNECDKPSSSLSRILTQFPRLKCDFVVVYLIKSSTFFVIIFFLVIFIQKHVLWQKKACHRKLTQKKSTAKSNKIIHDKILSAEDCTIKLISPSTSRNHAPNSNPISKPATFLIASSFDVKLTTWDYTTRH